MSGASNIEWTDATWNPVTGCTKLSPGCKHCYAKTLHDKRHRAYLEGKKMPAQYAHPFEHVMLHPDRLDWPLRWRGSPVAKIAGRPSRIFVNSVSDLFHEDVPDEFIDRVFAVMGSCPWHTFQVLTKRADRMREWFAERWQPAPEKSQRDLYDAQMSMARELGISQPLPAFVLDTKGEDRFDQVYTALDDVPRCVDTKDDRLWKDGQSNLMAGAWPLKNVWLGVSVEDQAAADERIPLLLQTPAAIRWISAEPLLGPINLDGAGALNLHAFGCGYEGRWRECPEHVAGRKNCAGLDWVVAGGESGLDARPSHPSLFQSLRDQCATAGVPYFFKQWGAWGPVGPLYSDDDTPEHLNALECDDDGPMECHVEPFGGRWSARLDGQPPPGTWAMQKIGKRASGRLLDGVEHNEYPASPSTTTKEPQ